jgi:predicted MFS family arabinose efflux permease
MSAENHDGPPTEQTEAAHSRLGVLATWRRTPTAARALLAGVFVNRLAGFLVIFLVLFMTDRGFSAAQAGLALGVYGAGSVLGTLVGGYLSDRLSARQATLISMFGTALLLLAILYAGYYPLILLAVMTLSVVGVVYRPAAQTMLTELVPASQLVMVNAMYRLCLNLGTTAAPRVGVALVSVSYDLLFWGEAAAALIYGLIAIRYLPRRPKKEAGQEAAAEQATEGPAKRSGYLAVLSDVRYVFFLAAVFLVMTVYVQYTASLPLAIQDAELSLWWYGTVVTLNAVMVVALEVPLTRFVQSWPIRRVALLGFGLIAIGYAMYAIGITPALLIIGTIIWTANEIIGGPTTFAYPGLVAPAHLRGRYYGAMQSAVGLAIAVGPVVGVALWAEIGQLMWWCAVGVGLLSALCAWIGMRKPDETPSGNGDAPTDSAEPTASQPDSPAEPAASAEPTGATPPEPQPDPAKEPARQAD